MAALIATLGAMIVATLVAYGVLPDMNFGGPGQPPNPNWPLWCLKGGFVVHCLVLIFWRPRQRIFLDILCIDQEDNDLKGAALVSMGAFLKSSDALVVFWDPSFTRRLWCVFELAAFLYSRPSNQTPKLTIRPTLLGPAFLSLHVGLFFVIAGISLLPPDVHGDFLWPAMGLVAFVGFYMCVAALRAYFQSVQLLESELADFSVKDSLCWCCSCNHRDRSGAPLSCDREVVFRCIIIWFGSLENFETKVRTEVLENLVDQLSKQIFTYQQCAAAALPVFWYILDSASRHAAYSDDWEEGTARRLLRGVGWAFGAIPVLFFIGSRLTYFLQSKRGNMCAEVAINGCILVMVIAVLVGMLILEQFLWGGQIKELAALNIKYNLLPGSAIFAAITMLLGTCLFSSTGRSCCAAR